VVLAGRLHHDPNRYTNPKLALSQRGPAPAAKWTLPHIERRTWGRNRT